MIAKFWNEKAKTVPFKEIPLFRVFCDAIRNGYKKCRIEEFHGNRNQVVFPGLHYRSWGRKIQRCELCDLLIITYQKNPTLNIRMTFLQAKRSKSTHAFCSEFPNYKSAQKFYANLEQWDLLSRRPEIIAVPPFRVDPYILKDAILPSVGTYGVFFKYPDGRIGFFYISSDLLKPSGAPLSKYACLKTKRIKSIERTLHGYTELSMACCISTFSVGLLNMMVGTPIHPDNPISAEDSEYRKKTRRWLAGIINSISRTNRGDFSLSREFVELLGATSEDMPFSTAPSSIILINNENPIEAVTLK